MPHEKLYPQFTLTEEKIEELKSIVPEAFADGKINWESLKEALGEFLEEDEQDSEHFGLFWPGKRDAKKIAATPGTGTLIPVKGEGVNEENTKNIFIEGENLEVLKILQKSYANRIKMMYFDPPYNTGNDFIYEDDFTETIDEYLRRTGQTDEEGKPMTTNKKSDGRFHSKWLSMMYPRLKLSRNLLTDDGVIFISIDDNEVHNLREIMNEIFGEENFIALLPTIMNLKGNQDEFAFAGTHEYTLVYAQNKVKSIFYEFELDDEGADDWEEDEYGFFKKGATMKSSGVNAPREKRPNLFYPLLLKENNKVETITDDEFMKIYDKQKKTFDDHYIKKLQEKYEKQGFVFLLPKSNGSYVSWRWQREKVISEPHNIIMYLDDESFSLNKKQRPSMGELPSKKPKTIFYKPEYSSGNGTNQIKELFSGKIFNNPKPLELIKDFLRIGAGKNALILDLFAGSGTTAQALLELNQDGGDRKFILVQMPEKTDEKTEANKAGYKNIAEICKERIRRVIKKIDSKKNENNSDRGFKVFKLNKSNYKGWQNYEEEDINKLETLFESFESPLIDNWKKENLVNEIVLLEGFPLDSTIEKIKEFKDNEVNKVTTDFHEHKLLISLDQKIKKSTIKNLNLNEKDVFICLDSSITDEEKMTLSDKGLIKTI